MSLFQRIKQPLFFLAQAVLCLRIGLLLLDPVFNPEWVATTGRVLPIYESWRGAIDAIYVASAVIQLPLQWLTQALLVMMPSLQTDQFPVMATSQLGPLVQSLLKSTSFLPWPAWMSQLPASAWLPGFIDWISVVTLVSLFILNPLVDHLAKIVGNFWWTILIEFSFNEKKQASYKEALKKRADELGSLSVQYRNLSKEVSMMAESIITDELTKVYNKRFYLAKVEELFSSMKENRLSFTLIMLDIDYFKKVNDTYGHLVGDEVLVAVASVARQMTPDGAFCCRFGGEEFALLMPCKDLAQGLQVANSIRKQCLTLTFTSVPELRTSVSAGVAFVDFDKPQARNLMSYEGLVKLADDELYRAKLEGRNRVCYTQLDAPETVAPAPLKDAQPVIVSATSQRAGGIKPSPVAGPPPDHIITEEALEHNYMKPDDFLLDEHRAANPRTGGRRLVSAPSKSDYLSVKEPPANTEDYPPVKEAGGSARTGGGRLIQTLVIDDLIKEDDLDLTDAETQSKVGFWNRLLPKD